MGELKNILGKLLWLLVAAAVAAEVSYIASHHYFQQQRALSNQTEVFSGAPPSYASQSKVTLIDLYKKASPAIVRIDADSQSKSQVPNKEYLGTGFFVDTNGDILTNYHVIQGSNTVNVVFADGYSSAAKIIGSDPSNDVAVLKVSDMRNITPLAIGNSDTVEIGEQVAAIGNPLGLNGSLSEGIVSQLSRSIQAPNGFTISNVIQTDAPIDHGSSGGPLFDPWGRVVGVITAIQAVGSGIGYAIPINQVLHSARDILSGKVASYAWLGVETVPVPANIAKVLGFHSSYGALITTVVPGSPAARAGLQACNKQVKVGKNYYKSGCDIIIAVGSQPVHDSNELAKRLAPLKPGQVVSVIVRRGAKTLRLKVTLGTRR